MGYLASILNNPNEVAGGGLGGWSAFLGLTSEPLPAEEPPALAPGVLPEVLPSDFEAYLRRIRVQYARFVATREMARQASERDGSGGGGADGARGDDGTRVGSGSTRSYWVDDGGGGSAGDGGGGRGGRMAGGEGALERGAAIASRLEREAAEDGAVNAGAMCMVAPPGTPGSFPIIGAAPHGLTGTHNLRFRSQGSGLVRAMREIPEIYFQQVAPKPETRNPKPRTLNPKP